MSSRDDVASLSSESMRQDALSCEEVARLLGMPGRGPARYCPSCQKNVKSGQSKLVLGEHFFECTSCTVQGDPSDLVALVKGCTPEQANAWLADKVRERLGVRDPSGAADHRRHAFSPVFEAFLEYTRPVPDKVAVLLEKWGLTQDTIKRFGVRYYFHGLRKATKQVYLKFDGLTLRDAGLIVQVDDLASCFEPYRIAKIPYLIVPYLWDGRPVFLRGKPLTGTSKLKDAGLPASLTSATEPPCLFNTDVIEGADRIVVVRNDFDAMGLTTRGLSAVACGSLSNFKPEWVPLMTGKRVYFAIDQAKLKDSRLENIRLMFEAGGLEKPEIIGVPNGSTGLKLAKRLIDKVGLSKVTKPAPAAAPPTPRANDDDPGTLCDVDDYDDELDPVDLPDEFEFDDDEFPVTPPVVRPVVLGEFIAAIELAESVSLTVHKVDHDENPHVRCQTWWREGPRWVADEDEFNIPGDKLDALIEALAASRDGQAITDRPSWLPKSS